MDASDAAITAARSGSVPLARDVKSAAALPTYTPSTSVRSVAAADASGIVVECVQEGGRLRVHVVSGGYDPAWNVQFPRHVRRAGARYAVDDLTASSGGFYRVRGEIRQLV